MSDLLFGPEPIVWIQQTLGPAWAAAARVLSLAGSTWGVIFAVGVALWLWGREEAHAMVAIVLLEAGVNVVLNQLVHLPRPDATSIVKYEHVPMASFPSGHVFTATVLWGFLWARRRVPLTLSAAVVAGVMLSRLFLGVHFVGDVIGGAVFGVVLVAVHLRAWPAVRAWLGRRSTAFYRGLSALGVAAAAAATAFLGSNAAGWNAAGVLAAAAVALPLGERYVPDAPPRHPTGRLLALSVGSAGLLPFLLVDRLTGEGAVWLGALMCFLATGWAVLLMPLLCAGLRSVMEPVRGAAPDPTRYSR
jgi:membrane-associated phospholipid phosphatase